MNTPRVKCLIVEDDFISRKFLEGVISQFGDCDFAENGEIALEAFSQSLRKKEPYHLICLDIMLPQMDGHSVLTSIRSMEEELGISANLGVKVIVTSALDDSNNVLSAFRAGCESYLVKPILRDELIEQLRKLKLIG